jgi:hypothetical protein
MTRAYNTATTQQNSGGAVAGVTAGKNVIINGGFDIWQRGTSSSVNGGYLTADRWAFDSSNATKSQQTTGAPNGSRYVLRNAFTSGSSAYSSTIQYIETNQVVPLWGQTVTGSVKLRRSSGMASSITFFIQKNVTVDAGPGNGGWTTITTTVASNASLPTGTGASNWFTATFTVAIPNDGTANSLRVLVVTDSEPGNGSYWEMAQCQLELGSVATPFSRAGGTIQGELAACQRYYNRVNGSNVGGSTWINGHISGTSPYYAISCYQYPVEMRVAPTITQSGSVRVSSASSLNDFTSFAGGAATKSLRTLYTPTGVTNGYACHIDFLSSAYIEMSAEL